MFNFLKNFFINLKRKKINFIKFIQKHLEWEKKIIKRLHSQSQEKFKFPSLKQLKYFPTLLNKKEKVVIVSLLVFIIFSLSALLIRFQFQLPLKPALGGEYTEGIVGQPKLNNPLFSSINEVEADITRLIFSSLVKWKNGEIVADLAERWRIENEGKDYVFQLRKGVFWHDGKEFNADDVIFTVKLIQDEKTKSPLRESLINVKVKKIDNYQVEFSLETPFSPFLTFLTFGILPKHLLKDVPPEDFALNRFNLSPIGTGPFKFKKLLKSENEIRGIILERNKKYYLKSPYLEKINFKFFSTLEEAFLALQAKKIEGLALVEKTDKENLPKVIHLYELPLSSYTAIFLNRKKEFLTKAVREALILSINKKEIIEELENVEDLNTSIVHPKFKKQNKKYEYNFSLAKEKLKEEKFQKKDQWFSDKKGEILEINLVSSDHPRHKKVSEMIKNFWETLGIKTNLEILTKEDFEKVLKEKDYDALLYGIIEGYDPDPFPLWHSSQIKEGMNLANLKNIKVDTLLEKARMSFDENERKKYYLEFQEIIDREIPVIFLYQRSLDYFIDKKIKGFNLINLALPSDRFANIEDWYIKTKRGRNKN